MTSPFTSARLPSLVSPVKPKDSQGIWNHTVFDVNSIPKMGLVESANESSNLWLPGRNAKERWYFAPLAFEEADDAGNDNDGHVSYFSEVDNDVHLENIKG